MMPSMMMQSPSDESDCSDSNTSNSSDSSSSSGNSGQDINELFETAKILSERLNLPKDLCENRAIFDEFFSLDTWNELPDNVQTHLKTNFLPNFPESNEVEKDITVEQLFTGQIERFGQRPLDRFQYNLEEGNYRPDIAKLQTAIERSRRHEQRFQECERASRMAKMLVISREKLLRAVVDAPPGTSLRPERVQMGTPKLTSSGAALRAKKRYFEEISAVAEEVGLPTTFSDDENYPEGPPPQLSKKQKRHLTGIQVRLDRL
jgi:nuclear factor related to kappa-B-binding protein